MNAHVAPQPFSDGIYFGLDSDPYHADPALGSTDLKQLAAEPAAYWFGSSLNPDKPVEEEDKAHRILGSAVHKFVLEGPQAFNGLFERAPGDDEDDVLRSADDLSKWLKDASAAKIPATKAARVQLIREMCEVEGGPLLPRMMDQIQAEAKDAGRTLLKADDYDRIQLAGGAVLDNPHLGGSFHGGMPEVSVFWTDVFDGEAVRRKARFDFLKPRAVVDLKSTRPQDNLPFIANCRKALASWNYPAQASTYLDGRARLPALVAEGKVFGDHDPEWLKRVAAAADYAFVFVFWASAGAPLTWGGVMSPGSPVLDVGAEYVRRGIENYVNARRTYGSASPWITHEPLEEIELDHLPRWYGAA